MHEVKDFSGVAPGWASFTFFWAILFSRPVTEGFPAPGVWKGGGAQFCQEG